MAGFLLSCSFLEGNHWKWEWSIAILLYYEFSIWHLYIRMLSYYKWVPTKQQKLALFPKKKANNFFPKSCFWFENTHNDLNKKWLFNIKNHSKTKRSENKTMVGWISSNISSHHIQPPTINENEFTPDPHDPHPRRTRQQEETSWRLTRWWFSNNEIWLLKKNVTIPLKRVVFFSEIHG